MNATVESPVTLHRPAKPAPAQDQRWPVAAVQALLDLPLPELIPPDATACP